MNLSFYSAGAGAIAQQGRLDVIANNLTNSNTYGYKSQKASFSDLLYKNIRAEDGVDNRLRQGCGAKVEKTDALFSQGAFYATSQPFDFMIAGDGFFAIENQNTGEINFTRDGSFHLSQDANGDFYLVAGDNEFVLDSNGNHIKIENENDMPDIGIFSFPINDGMLCVGNNRFQPTPKNGNPYLNTESQLMRGNLEASNVNMSVEMADMIQAQRSYQLALRMMTTSDEIENTVNNLR